MEKTESSGLTAEQKQWFRDKLRRKGAVEEFIVDAFIDDLDSYMPAAKWQLSREPVNITSARKHQKAGLEALKKAICCFERAYLEMYPSDDLGSVVTYLSHYEPTAGLYKLRDRLNKEFSSIKPGRPAGIEKTPVPDKLQIVIQEIVFLFRKHFGIPTKYKYRENPLFVVVRKTLEILNCPRGDLSRRIEAAIKNLKN